MLRDFEEKTIKKPMPFFTISLAMNINQSLSEQPEKGVRLFQVFLRKNGLPAGVESEP